MSSPPDPPGREKERTGPVPPDESVDRGSSSHGGGTAFRAARAVAPFAVGLLLGLVAAGLRPGARAEHGPDRALARGEARGSHAVPGASDRPARAAAGGSMRWHPLRPGPWGMLEATEVKLEPPADHLDDELCSTEVPPWKFPDLSRADLDRLFEEARLSSGQRDTLLRAARCVPPDQGGCVASTDVAFVAGLDPHARGVLYRALARYPENGLYFYAFRRRPDQVEDWFAASGLSERMRAEIRALMFPTGEYETFADRPLLCSRLSTAEERRKLLKALSRTPSLLVQMRIPEGADAARIADYWNAGGRRKDVTALIPSLVHNPGGGVLDVSHLLPSFARARLFTFPSPGEPPWDCHWTSLNFFASTPDDRFLDAGVLKRTTETEYEPIAPHDARLGDIVIFEGRAKGVVHSAVYVAADVVFTKNGASFRRPWLLMKLSEVVAGYFGDGSVSLHYLRRKVP